DPFPRYDDKSVLVVRNRVAVVEKYLVTVKAAAFLFRRRRDTDSVVLTVEKCAGLAYNSACPKKSRS
ncbi:MAG TPA: hypothetical protein VF511_09370, partial [Chthoniobacterales bacterium]